MQIKQDWAKAGQTGFGFGESHRLSPSKSNRRPPAAAGEKAMSSLIARAVLAASLVTSVAFAATSASAADYEVKMLNKGAKGAMVFEPDFLKVAPGDTVTFKATNPGHNVESVDGMLPAGVAGFEGGLGKDYTMTFTTEGVYGIKCKPHYIMGMVALIVVGDPASNLEAAKAVKHPGKAGTTFAALFGGL
jgi:pseudoazurin